MWSKSWVMCVGVKCQVVVSLLECPWYVFSYGVYVVCQVACFVRIFLGFLIYYYVCVLWAPKILGQFLRWVYSLKADEFCEKLPIFKIVTKPFVEHCYSSIYLQNYSNSKTDFIMTLLVFYTFFALLFQQIFS